MTENLKLEQILSKALFPSVIVDKNGLIINILNNIEKFIKPEYKIIAHKTKLIEIVFSPLKKAINTMINDFSKKDHSICKLITKLENSLIMIIGLLAEFQSEKYILISFISEDLYYKNFGEKFYINSLNNNNSDYHSEKDINNSPIKLNNKNYHKNLKKHEENFNFEITEFAFEIMEGSRDVQSAINILLNKIGKHFDLSRITIQETIDINNNLKSCKNIYQWCNKNIIKTLNSKELFTNKEILYILSKFDNNGIYTYTEGIDKKPDKYPECFISSGTKSTLKCIFFDDGNFKGLITFDDLLPRIWKDDEKKTLKIISKIISSYFFKMKYLLEANQRVKRLTGFDSITGIMKYDKFKKEASNILKNTSPNHKYILIYSDFINFKYINETYGYKNGDRILKEYAVHMTLKIPETIIMSRIYSDNFCILMKFDKNTSDSLIAITIDKYNQSFAQIQKRLYQNFKFIVTCGVYIIKDNSMHINQIIDNANIARKYAKNTLSENCILFKEVMEHKMKHNIEIQNSMEKALYDNEFKVYLQGKVDLKTGRVVGAEALVRWIKKDGNFIPPIEFIPVFEQNGFVTNLDFFVYKEVCRFLSKRIKKKLSVVPISVNVSRVHLEKGGFLKKIIALTDKYSVPHNLLEFELTENIFLQNSNSAIETMNGLRDAGFKVSMDDFGSGYSSLNLLKNLPVDVLKLDKGFFDNNELRGNDEVVISSVIEMAKKMQIVVLCEGVETKQQVEFLLKAGCDLVQGYYFCRPISIPEFSKII